MAADSVTVARTVTGAGLKKEELKVCGKDVRTSKARTAVCKGWQGDAGLRDRALQEQRRWSLTSKEIEIESTRGVGEA
jgi:hypothetical protein